MGATKVIDELIDAGFQALESGDSAAFMEWRRRVAVALGPDHVYTQLFQGPVNNKSKNAGLNGASNLTSDNEKAVAQKKRVA
jgi:hypothetical protein